ncbi:insulinase family protein [Permianibacter sp. IMCC34836]|uniref:M16 family metallopeptidase n=1 Tax=Permianibacter fluminis TaxID=2738515 RepID=UPI0015561ED2|nr:pitrilysin family protein [Permianibacter fluminis]NQD37608.1 insulinase family protein [Permianibacter fluminis]
MNKLTTLLAAAFGVFAGTLSGAANADFELPAFERYQLDNGLTVYLMPQKEVPLVHVRLDLPAGAIADGDAYGIALLTAESLLLGSKRYSKEQLEKAFDLRGASVTANADLETAGITAEFVNQDTDTLLPMLVDALLQPSFPADEFNKKRDRRLQELELMRQSPRQVIGNYFQQLMYRDSVYANPVSGLQSSVKALDRDAIERFYRQHYVPQGSALIVVGDYDAKAMKKRIAQAFSSWRGNAAGKTEEPAAVPVAVDKARVVLVNKPDAIETTLYIGGAGVARNHPDYNALTVVNTILGGRFTSWLNDELRVNSGLTYGARSQLQALRGGGLFNITTFTAKANTEKAIDLALKTYQRLWTQGIDDATLASAKAYVKGLYPPKFETAADLAEALTVLHHNHMSKAQFDRFLADVEGLTVERANQLARQHLPQDKLQFVLIGNAADIGGIAGKYGEVKQVDISTDSYQAF